jgi:hypothetical protein
MSTEAPEEPAAAAVAPPVAAEGEGAPAGSDTFYLEQVTLDESDDEYNYDAVAEDPEDEDDDGEEDFNAMKQALAATGEAGVFAKAPATTGKRDETVDDFLRNFLVKLKLTKTLDVFQTEWYELAQKGALSQDDIGAVPDIYLRNQQLDDQLKTIKSDLYAAQQVAEKARGTWDKFRKERDFHKMHHKRVMQEKNKLVTDIKRLKKHYQTFEPTLGELRHKYETAMKEKMLIRLERDRLAQKVASCEERIRQLEGEEPEAPPAPAPRPARGDSVLPPEDRANPFHSVTFDKTPVETYTLEKTFKGHMAAVSDVCIHPKKPVVVTVSDDTTWKMWSLPNGDLVMSGDGHKDWVSGCDFHPHGSQLCTTSGDATVKIWDFANARCAHTFTDHTQAVWGAAYHDCGDFVVSCSMDHTARLWDLGSYRCRQTFRGHVDSVNHVIFQPYTNNICTCSGDKTVSLWDSRTGLCIQTFYGHMNAVNSVAFNLRGDTIASADADGAVKLWDVRMVAERGQLADGPHPANKCSFDRSGQILAVTSDNGTVSCYDLESQKEVATLQGHEDAVQAVVFDPFGKFMVTAGSDSSFRLWN